MTELRGVDLARAALAADPLNADAWLYLGQELSVTDPAEAERAFRRALELRPGQADALNGLGALRQRAEDPRGAVGFYRRAVEADPGFGQAWANLGWARLRLHDFAGAEAALRRALELVPDQPAAASDLGLVLKYQGREDEAEAAFRRALAIVPDHADARFNLGRLLLSTGKLDEGWPLYDARWRTSSFPSVRRAFDLPVWKGEPLVGKRLLVWGEQGVGDEVMFATLLPDLQARGARLVVECDPRLTGLLSRALPGAEVVARTDPPSPRLLRGDIDLQVPMGGVARRSRADLAAFTANRPFLSPDPERVAGVRQRLAALGPGLLVGLCWTSGLRSAARDSSYSDLADWAALFAVPGIRMVCLQYNQNEVAGEIEAFEAATGHRLHRFPDIDLKRDLEGAAALAACLDLVVSAPTSVGEMAAALGVPTWRIVPGDDWTRLGTNVRPWHPAMRQFVRGAETPGALAARMAHALSQLATTAPSQHASTPAEPAAELLAKALALHQRGDLAGAEPLYRAALAGDPGNADALHLLGLVRHQLGDRADAEALIRRALALDPDFPEAHNSLGSVLLALGRKAEATACFREALRLAPGYDKARENLARVEAT